MESSDIVSHAQIENFKVSNFFILDKKAESLQNVKKEMPR